MKKIIFMFIFMITAFLCLGESITILAEDAFPPYSYKNGDKVEGISVDIVIEAFKTIGIDVIMKLIPYTRGLEKVKDGEEIAVFNVPNDPAILNLFNFPKNQLWDSTMNFFSLSDKNFLVKEYKDLEGKIVGIVEGFPCPEQILKNDKIIKDWSKSDEICLKKLITKRVDVIIFYSFCSDYYIKKLDVKGKIKSIGSGEKFGGYIVFSKTNSQGKKYCDLFDKGMIIIKDNGSYDKIITNWKSKF